MLSSFANYGSYFLKILRLTIVEWDGLISKVKSLGISICSPAGIYPLAYNIYIIMSIELDIYPITTAGVSFNLLDNYTF